MKRFVIFIIVTVIYSSLIDAQVKVMSFNIRLDVTADGDNRWDLRKEKVASLMNYYGADFIGCQEVQQHQLQYLLSQLRGYNFIGVARDDGKQAGEYSCIFFNAKNYTLLRQSTFWLSTTPDSVSMGWDAACKRVCTYGLFQSITTGEKLWVFNTHLDHMGVVARLESVKLIQQRVAQITEQQNYPVILTGDFNAHPEDEPVTYMNRFFKNARDISITPPYGPADTWNGFAFGKNPEGCIDYIFIAGTQKITVEKFATITDSYQMKYYSDHFPILATLYLKGKNE